MKKIFCLCLVVLFAAFKVEAVVQDLSLPEAFARSALVVDALVLDVQLTDQTATSNEYQTRLIVYTLRKGDLNMLHEFGGGYSEVWVRYSTPKSDPNRPVPPGGEVVTGLFQKHTRVRAFLNPLEGYTFTPLPGISSRVWAGALEDIPAFAVQTSFQFPIEARANQQFNLRFPNSNGGIGQVGVTVAAQDQTGFKGEVNSPSTVDDWSINHWLVRSSFDAKTQTWWLMLENPDRGDQKLACSVSKTQFSASAIEITGDAWKFNPSSQQFEAIEVEFSGSKNKQHCLVNF